MTSYMHDISPKYFLNIQKILIYESFRLIFLVIHNAYNLYTYNFSFHVSNKGLIAMQYNWDVTMEQTIPTGRHSITFEEARPPTSMELVARPGSAVSTLISSVDYNPFTIEPTCGTILPGKKANFKLKFSPLDVQEFEGKISCM